MIKTASWFTPLPDDHVRIGISRGTPRYMQAGDRQFRRLAPGPWFNNVNTAEYIRRYSSEILAQLDPQQTADQLLELAGGKVPVLVCFERIGSGHWCHRALAASWLAEGLGKPVPELGHEELKQDRHPLLPAG
jgi:hypothetical protein